MPPGVVMYSTYTCGPSADAAPSADIAVAFVPQTTAQRQMEVTELWLQAQLRDGSVGSIMWSEKNNTLPGPDISLPAHSCNGLICTRLDANQSSL